MTDRASTNPLHEFQIIRPIREKRLLDPSELWRFRYLFVILVWRTLKVRYQQTAIGVGWAVLQPLLLAAIFTVIFGVLAQLPTDGQPYLIFVLSGLVVWQFVAQSVQAATTSIVANAQLVTRIYFPRLLLLLAVVAAALADLLCGLGVLGALMLWYGSALSWGGLLAFLPTVLLAVTAIMGVSMWLGTLYVRYRDVGHLLPFLVQIWMFASPVIYPLSLLPAKYQLFYALNPLVVVIQTSRWAFAGGTAPPMEMVLLSWAVALGLCGSGLWFLRRHEGTFADII